MKYTIIIFLFLISSCASYRTEPYKPSMKPAKEYQKTFKADWPEYG